MILTREAPNISSKSGYDWRVLSLPSGRVTGLQKSHTRQDRPSLGVVQYRPSLVEEPQAAEVTHDRIVQAWVLWSVVLH